VRALRIAQLALRNFRNIERADLADLPRFAVLSGDNGQGKTSVLEAIYLVCTTRSFRTAKPAEAIAHGAQAASVRATLVEEEGDESREQSVGLEGPRRKVMAGGKRPSSLASYAISSPVVVFHPGEMTLSSGPAGKRRTLLDRIALFVDPTSMDHQRRYTAASRARQRLLETRGSSAAGLAAFEALMAVHGAALSRARAEASRRLAGDLVHAFEKITKDSRPLEARYQAGGPEDERALELALGAGRERDQHRGSAGAGPHRDDLGLLLGGYDVRIDASQGEHRAVTLALKMAELSCIAGARGLHPILLLDDVSSELDLARTSRLFEYLRKSPGQIVLTTTRPELIDTTGLEPGDRRDYRLDSGVVREAFRHD
jgi:DNA replication and repair protein RecF